MKKTIIVLWGTANVGKSMTLASLGRHLHAAGAVATGNISSGDYRAIFNYQQRIVGVQTFGDYEPEVAEGLEDFRQGNCDVIAIAAKSYGATVDTLGSFAAQHKYRLIWCAPYEVRDGSIATNTIKNYCAEHLLLMINDIIAGRL